MPGYECEAKQREAQLAAKKQHQSSRCSLRVLPDSIYFPLPAPTSAFTRTNQTQRMTAQRTLVIIRNSFPLKVSSASGWVAAGEAAEVKLRILALAGAANVNIPVPAADPVTPEPRQPQETTHTLTHARVVGGGGRMARLLRCPRLEELQMPSLKSQGRPSQRSQRSVNSHISAFFPLRIRQNVGKVFLGRSFPREAR